MEALDPVVGRRILAKIESLAGNPRPSGCVKLSGSTNLWRIRIGDWRVIYAIEEDRRIVDIRVVRHRGDVYR
jgi:mRNA interferase RelE/StbE